MRYRALWPYCFSLLAKNAYIEAYARESHSSENKVTIEAENPRNSVILRLNYRRIGQIAAVSYVEKGKGLV